MKPIWSLLAGGLGIVLLGVAAGLSFWPVSDASSLPSPEQTMRAALLVVAAKDVPAGMALTPQDLGEINAPKAYKTPNTIAADSAAAKLLVGAITMRTLKAGELVQQSDVQRVVGHQSLAQQLNPGMRAVVIAIDPTQARAAAIRPQDKVDIILNANAALGGGFSAAPARVFRNLRVLAVDGRTVFDVASVTDTLRAGTGGNGSVVVEVPAIQAASLAVSAASSAATLMLRRPADPVESPAPPPQTLAPVTASVGAVALQPPPRTIASSGQAVEKGRGTPVLIIRGEP